MAKNLIDLLGKPNHISHTRDALLFKDDQQVHGLSVRCDHGRKEPFIWITAMPFSGVLHSLDVIGKSHNTLERRETFDSNELDMNIDLLRDLERSKDLYDGATYSKLHKWHRGQTQSSWLKGSRITPEELQRFYPNSRWDPEPWKTLFEPLKQSFIHLFHGNLGRILLKELPQRDGESTDYREHVRAEFNRFRSRFGRHLFPMDTPLAIEVLVKPPSAKRQRGLHDLDNVCRDYLIPQLVEIFQPPLTLDDSRPLSGSGLVRYEAWRVSRKQDDDSPGFVSVSLVSDLFSSESLITRINQDAESVMENLA